MTRAEAEAELRSHRPDDDFLRFVRALDEVGGIGDVGDLLYLLEKPEKYAAEYEAWVEGGKPDDDIDPSDLPGWRRFMAVVHNPQ